MTPPRGDKAAAKSADEAAPDAAPPFWIADRELPVGAEMGAEAMPVRAFSPGDQVPPGHVEQYGWRPYVHAPPGDWPPPEPAPQTATGQNGSE